VGCSLGPHFLRIHGLLRTSGSSLLSTFLRAYNSLVSYAKTPPESWATPHEAWGQLQSYQTCSLRDFLFLGSYFFRCLFGSLFPSLQPEVLRFSLFSIPQRASGYPLRRVDLYLTRGWEIFIFRESCQVVFAIRSAGSFFLPASYSFPPLRSVFFPRAVLLLSTYLTGLLPLYSVLL